MTVVDLKLRIQVLLLVSLIDEAVKALSIGSVLVQNIHAYDILTNFQEFRIKLNSVSIINLVNFLSIYVQLRDLVSKVIEENTLLFFHLDCHVDLAEILVTFEKRQIDIVMNVLNCILSVNRFLLG